MRAKDVMTKPCITVSPDATVSEIASLLIKHHISGVPVIDGNGKIVGIVSEGDLIRRVETGTAKKPRSWWLSMVSDPDQMAADFVKAHARKARDVMTRSVITVDDDAPLAEIAGLLEKNHIKRVPVVCNGELVGIVSRANLVQCLAATRGHGLELPSPSDDEIRRRLTEALEREPWAYIGRTNITVSKGVVELWGFVGSKKEIQATRAAAEEIPGVAQVLDHRAIGLGVSSAL